jgi:hypothetical protein
MWHSWWKLGFVAVALTVIGAMGGWLAAGFAVVALLLYRDYAAAGRRLATRTYSDGFTTHEIFHDAYDVDFGLLAMNVHSAILDYGHRKQPDSVFLLRRNAPGFWERKQTHASRDANSSFFGEELARHQAEPSGAPADADLTKTINENLRQLDYAASWQAVPPNLGMALESRYVIFEREYPTGLAAKVYEAGCALLAVEEEKDKADSAERRARRTTLRPPPSPPNA